jgi:hypothetical protein
MFVNSSLGHHLVFFLSINLGEILDIKVCLYILLNATICFVF